MPQIVKRTFVTFIIFLLEIITLAKQTDALLLIQSVFIRVKQVRISQAAGSLTFTTLLALVPLVTIALAVFTTFPAFAYLQKTLENYFIESLMPKPVASTITQYLTLFAGKAKGLSLLGASLLLFTALALFASIERTLNELWQAPTPPWLSRRWLIYLAAVLFLPFLVGVGFYLVIDLFASLKGWSPVFGQASRYSLQWLPAGLACASWAFVFKYMPNTRVRWSHAWIGALISSAFLWLLKYVFVVYVLKFGNFKQLYGAFSVIPAFLMWLYLGWLVTLLGAAVAAVLTSFARIEGNLTSEQLPPHNPITHE